MVVALINKVVLPICGEMSTCNKGTNGEITIIHVNGLLDWLLIIIQTYLTAR